MIKNTAETSGEAFIEKTERNKNNWHDNHRRGTREN